LKPSKPTSKRPSPNLIPSGKSRWFCNKKGRPQQRAPFFITSYKFQP
jgi:hypothetical protein